MRVACCAAVFVEFLHLARQYLATPMRLLTRPDPQGWCQCNGTQSTSRLLRRSRGSFPESCGTRWKGHKSGTVSSQGAGADRVMEGLGWHGHTRVTWRKQGPTARTAVRTCSVGSERRQRGVCSQLRVVERADDYGASVRAGRAVHELEQTGQRRGAQRGGSRC